MSIKKILKFYLVVTLMLTVFAAVSYNEEFKRYMSYSTNVFGYKYNEPKLYAAAYNPKSFLNKTDFSNIYYKENPYNLVFNISNDASKSMVANGAQGVEIMILNFKPLNESQVLKNLTFKIVGAGGNDIKAAYLISDEKNLSSATISNKYVTFSNVNYEIGGNNLASIKVVLDLTENFKIGNRFRFDIENPEDIGVGVDDKLFSVNGSYPMKGKYLAISRKTSVKTR